MGEFVWNISDFSQSHLFTTDNIAFLLEFVLFYVGISFCIGAEKTPRHLFFSSSAALFGALGFWSSGFFTNVSIYKMVCLVAAAFWGAGLTYLLASLLKRIFGNSKLGNWFSKHQSLIARIFGVLLIAGTLCIVIYRVSVLAALFVAVTVKCVLLWLTRHNDSGRLTHTYDDIVEKRDGNKKRAWLTNVCILVSTFFMLLYLSWRIFFTLPYQFGVFTTIASVLLLAVEILGAVDSFTHYKNMHKIGEYPLPEVNEEDFPDVDVFVSTYSESTQLLRKTLLACKRMDYPDKEKVHIYLCDDGQREEMRDLADEVGVNYLVRDTHKGAKAGNLNFALANSSSPYIVTFDADMQPRSCFLLRTIPYFIDAEQKNRALPKEKRVKLGLLQTPQSFYDTDLYQYNLYSEGRIPNEQDYFYRYIQVARTQSNSVIYGGSNTVMSRKALNSAGGFYEKAITEDFATGIMIEKKGFVSLGTSEPLASGMNPHNLRDLIQQRVRWARGVIDSGRKMHIITSPNLTAAQKMNYWSSVWYWYAPIKRLTYILFPILFALFGATIFQYTLPELLIFWLPMYAMTRISQRLLGHHVRTAKWTEIYETSMFPFLLFPVILESFGISLKSFKVTNKERKTEKTGQVLYMLPFLLLIVLSIIGVANCVRVILSGGSIAPAILILWLLNNLFLLVMSMFFTLGRRAKENAESVSVELTGVLAAGEDRYECSTRTISENEITLELNASLPEDTIASMELQTERYQTKLDLKLLNTVAVRKKRRGEARYRCTFAVTSCDNYDHLLAILYDRVPALPNRIVADGGIFEDLRRNIWRRLWPFSKKN